MAENVQSNIIINVDTKIGIAEIKNLQRQVASLNAQLLKSGAAQARAAENVQRNLLNNINATGQFAANVRNISSTTETFTNRLEKNKLGLGEYFRYAGGASKTFGRLFRNEFDTIEKVARERVKTIQTQFTKLGRNANGSLQAIAVRPLALDMNNLATRTEMAAQKQQIFNQLVRQGSTNLLNFGKNTQWAGRQLMVGFSIPLAYLGTMAAKTFMQMEEQAIRFKRVYGDSFTASSETDKMLGQIKELASEFTKYGVAVEKTMQMAADAAAMGKMGSDLLAQVGQATRLAVLGGVEQDEALKTTISLTNAFGLAAEDLTGKIDFLNAVENQTVTSIEDLTIAIPKAAPVVRQLGGDIEDLTFFLTAMREGGINASESANALKSGLASIINPAEKTSKFLADLGINIKGIVDANAGDVKNTVIELAKALDTLDPLNRARAIEQLFGKFQFSRISTLFQNVVKEGTQAERVLKLSSSTMEELAILSERELKRIEDSPMYKFKKAVEDLKVSLVPLGEAFLKAVTPIVEFVKGFLDRFNEMGDGAKQFAVLITTVVAGIGPVLLMTFGLIANGAANIIKLFAAIKNVFSGVGGQSSLLGSQTEYLTQQQLEASAVASSLDQKHAKLIQTFTSETGAVNNLAAAYGRAVVAQSRLLGVPLAGAAGKNLPNVKKYKSGVVSVPGPKGAGDVVPAMLSPGEAVIPTKMAQKYGPLINSMISGSVPGYEDGRNVPYRYTPRDPSLAFPAQFLLEASHMSPGTGVLSPNKAKQVMNQEIDSLIRQGILKESMVDRSIIDKISKEVRLNSQTAGMLTKTFNQFFTDKNAVKDVSSVLRELSKTKALSGGSLIPNMDYLVKNGMVSQVRDSTTEKYLKDLDSSFRSMITNSKSKALSERQLQDIFVKAQEAAERKIASAVEKDSIRKANVFGRATTSPAIPGTGASGRTNLPNPYIGYRDTQEQLRSPETRKRLMSFAKVTDTWAMKNSMKTLAPQADRDAIKNLFRTLPEAEARKLMLALSATDGNAKDVRNIIESANKKTLKVPEIKSQPIQAAKSSKGSQVFSMTDILGQGAKAIPAGRAGIIARLFGKRFAFGTKSVKPFSRASMLASMLGRSNVAVRMKNEDFFSALASSGKNAKYKNAFETNTGADYIRESGSRTTRQRDLRSAMERDVFGLDPKATSPSSRPTYGYAKTSLLQSLVNSALGIRGKNFNSVTRNPADSLSRYGDIDLITKSSVAKRSSAFAGDALVNYNWATHANTKRSSPNLNIPIKNTGILPAPMRGASAGQMKNFERLGSPFQKYKNPPPAYVETYTPGGFDFKEIQKIIARDPAIAKQLKSELKAVGLGSVRVTGSDFISKLFSKMGIPGYNSGVVSVPGPKGAGDVVPAMLSPGEAVIPASMSKKYAPLISSMISDSIPGYRKGKKSFNFGDKYAGSQGMPLQPTNATPALAGKQMAESFTSRMKAAGTKLGDIAGTSLLRAQNFAADKMDRMQSRKPAPFIGPMTQPPVKQPGAMAGKLASGGSMLGMGAMMYGMSGAPGADVAGQIAMPLMMLSMVLPMILNPVGMVVAGLLAAAGGFVAVHLALDNIRRETSATARSLGAGKDAMSKFAEAAGTVTPSEFMDKRRELQFSPFDVKPGKMTFGQSFVQTESGQEMLSEFEKQVEKFGRSRAIESLQKKLTAAVATGVLSPEQAKSIANSLGQKLNDYGITANINASIQSILGPDGKLLEGNTIKIYTEFIQESGTGLTGTGGILRSEELTRGFDWWWDTEKVAQKEGEASGIITNFYDENQQTIDAFDAENLKNIDALFASGDFDKALKAEEKYQKDRRELIGSYNTEIQKMMDDFAGVDPSKQGAILRNLVDTAKQIDPKVGTAADRLRTAKVAPIMVGQGVAPRGEQLAQREAFKEAKITFIAQVAAGNIDSKTFSSLIGMFDPRTSSGQATLGVLAKITTDVGPAAIEQLDTVFKVLENPELAAEISVKVSRQDPEEAQKTVNSLTQISKFDGVGIESKVVLTYFGENPEELDDLTEKFTKLDLMKKKGTLDIQTLVEQQVLTTGDLAAFKQNETYFNSLNADQKVVYTQVYLTKLETVAENEIDAWYDKNQDSKRTRDQVASLLANEAATQYTVANPNADSTEEKTPGTPDSGQGSKKDILDSLLKKLQNVRKASVDVNGGMTELMSLLKTGKNFTGFSGIEQQLSLKGYSEEFIRFMADADKADQKRFMTMDKGIVKLKESGKALQNLFAAVTLGNFQRSIRESIGSITRELDARKTLIEVTGMAYNDAAQAARDAGLAEAIAAIKASTAIKNKNKAIRNAVKLYKEEQAAVESAKTVQEKFDDMYNAQMDLVNAKIATINVAFEIETDPFNDIIAAAQAEIDKKINEPGGLDDLQAGLQEISWQEEEINKKYDERLEALDKIEKANQKISSQQKSQLGVAEALSRGDISAAAKAAQELRSLSVEQSFATQRDLIEQSRAGELGGITATVNNVKKTRKQIEEDILKIEKQILKIEEDRLEPAREALRLATVTRDLKLDALDDEKLKWDELKAKIDLATASASKYLATLQAAMALLDKLGSAGQTDNSAYLAAAAEMEQSMRDSGATDRQIGNMLDEFPIAYGLDLSKLKFNYTPGYSSGGLVPKYFASGGFAKGTDTIPAMLTPGEFVVRKYAVDDFGADNLKAINSGTFEGSSVYNYEVNVNVSSTANPDEIARSVMTQIKRIDSQRIQGNRF